MSIPNNSRILACLKGFFTTSYEVHEIRGSYSPSQSQMVVYFRVKRGDEFFLASADLIDFKEVDTTTNWYVLNITTYNKNGSLRESWQNQFIKV